jgi:hypothetical protein
MNIFIRITLLIVSISVVYIIVNVAFAAMLLPMLIALVYFAHKRSSPVFICAVITVLLGMFQGIAIAGTTVSCDALSVIRHASTDSCFS